MSHTAVWLFKTLNWPHVTQSFKKKEVGGLIKTHRLRSSTAALFALLLLARAEKRASCVHSGPSAIVGKRSLVNV